MGALDHFELVLRDLKPGLNEFQFEIDDSFFADFEYSPVAKGSGKCLLSVDKKTNLLTIDFDITAKVELVCDRSLEPFDHKIELEQQLMVKFGDEDADIDEDIVSVRWDTQTINVAHFIYEYIVVSIPMKKLHPKFKDENESELGSIVFKSDEESDQTDPDPRWNALRNLN
ncbi:MAG: DUF177 domain-containing protein [Cyclobacteriaceae bacterium]